MNEKGANTFILPMKNILDEPVKLTSQHGNDIGKYGMSRRLYPILKWAGGKEQELKYIIPNLPGNFKDYYEPFVGGGAVYTAVQAGNYYINDKSEELISLYRSIINDDRTIFFKAVDDIIYNWDVLTKFTQENSFFFTHTYKQFSQGKIDEEKLKDTLFGFISKNSGLFNAMFSGVFPFNRDNFMQEIRVNLFRKSKRMKKLEQINHLLPDQDMLDNIEAAFKSAFYMHFRHLYNYANKYGLNAALKSAIFLFIRNFSYSGMFRYNARGDFNVPYGGIAYNRKNFLKKVDYLRTEALRSHLGRTTIENLDFEEFFQLHQPKKNDFIFLDPPYDSEFSTYAKNEFTKDDQVRLANYLIHKCKAQWMMIIKNTDFIYNLYRNKDLSIRSFDKTYLVSFMNRNDKNVEHLFITNY